MSHISQISKKLAIDEWQVENVIRLLDSGATIPFISRYRKEMTGSLDEVQIGQIKEEYERLQELDARREAIIKSIEEQGKMVPELMDRLNAAQTMSELEDIYLPFRPKRRTRAAIAREKVWSHWRILCSNNMNVTRNLLPRNICLTMCRQLKMRFLELKILSPRK